MKMLVIVLLRIKDCKNSLQRRYKVDFFHVGDLNESNKKADRNITNIKDPLLRNSGGFLHSNLWEKRKYQHNNG